MSERQHVLARIIDGTASDAAIVRNQIESKAQTVRYIGDRILTDLAAGRGTDHYDLPGVAADLCALLGQLAEIRRAQYRLERIADAR